MKAAPDAPTDAEIARHALTRVVGIDINDYACALARARLVMAALDASGTSDLTTAADLHPQVFWADGLDQVERDKQLVVVQPRLMAVGAGDGGDGSDGEGDGDGAGDGQDGRGVDTEAAIALALAQADSTTATLARPEVRERLAPHVRAGFHVVVANPPYITEKDKAKKRYHKEKVGGEARYVSAYGKYSLVGPFVERCFQVAVPGGKVGLIVANSFMKRVFGKALVEQVLPRHRLELVVDTSGAYIPGHGTPTVLLFGTPDRAPSDLPVRAVMGKRGEPSVPEVPAEGQVWRSIVEGADEVGYENEYVSVDELPRAVFGEHPWSLQGGGATKLQMEMEARSTQVLDSCADSIGITSFTLEDDVYILPPKAFRTLAIPPELTRIMVTGDGLRDWSGSGFDYAVWPYDDDFQPIEDAAISRVRHLWFFRANLSNSKMFGGVTKVGSGLQWFEYGRLTDNKLRTPLSIAFAFVATHNHFVLDRGGKVFKQSAPVIKLPPAATVDEHLALLGLLNSAVGDFWTKQVCQPKGGDQMGDGGRVPGDTWEDRYERDASKLALFPLPLTRHPVLESFARALDAHGSARVADSARAAIDAIVSPSTEQPVSPHDASPRPSTPTAPALRAALAARRERDLTRLYTMVALQDELDWLCYQLYGIESAPDGAKNGSPTFDPEPARTATTASDLTPTILAPDDVPPLAPGLRPFEIALARDDAERRAAIERGETPSQQPTEWFARHGWQAHADTAAVEAFVTERTGDPALAARYRTLVEERLARTSESKALSLVEQPTYKRRWYRPDYESEEREALEGWLADRLEDWAKEQRDPWTLRQASVALETDAAVQAVAEVLTGRRDYALEKELGRLVAADSVPNNKMHVFKAKGLEKRAAWEHTWALQHAEDRGEEVEVPVPPKYRSGDFRKTAYWRLRGKLDVPKERFIAFTEMPRAEGENALYGWAGWTPRERARVLLELDERAERAGEGLEARFGLLWGAWFLLPYVAWESEAAADEFRTIIGSLVGTAGVTEEMLARWATRDET